MLYFKRKLNYIDVDDNVSFHIAFEKISISNIDIPPSPKHWYVFIYKAVLGKLPWYICSKLELIKKNLNLRSSTWMRFKRPPVRTEASNRSLFYFGPWSWNDLQTRFKLASLISLHCFKHKISEFLATCCSCFDV